jgi:hypothetical protein
MCGNCESQWPTEPIHQYSHDIHSIPNVFDWIRYARCHCCFLDSCSNEFQCPDGKLTRKHVQVHWYGMIFHSWIFAVYHPWWVSWLLASRTNFLNGQIFGGCWVRWIGALNAMPLPQSCAPILHDRSLCKDGWLQRPFCKIATMSAADSFPKWTTCRKQYCWIAFTIGMDCQGTFDCISTVCKQHFS